MATLGIETISVFSLPPVEFVRLAAELGCQHVSTGLTSFGYNPHGFPPFSLRDDPALRREMIAAMRDLGVSISLGEGLTIKPDSDVGEHTLDMDIFAELGVRRINTVSLDPDLSRTFDQFGRLAELGAERGFVTTVELAPCLTVDTLETALAAVRHVGRPDFRLLIDTMHVLRSGATPEDVARVDPALIDYIQVSDAPRIPEIDNYFEEAMFERQVPGEGGLGLAELFAVLPVDRVYALEVPIRSEAAAGIAPHARLGKCVRALRALLDQTDAAI